MSPKIKTRFFEINLFAPEKKFREIVYVFLVDKRFNTKCGKKIFSFNSFLNKAHCVKSVRIRRYSGRYFPVFGKIRSIGESLRIQSECGKIPTRIIANTDTFYTVATKWFQRRIHNPDKHPTWSVFRKH